jgi:hypothetical protein
MSIYTFPDISLYFLLYEFVLHVVVLKNNLVKKLLLYHTISVLGPRPLKMLSTTKRIYYVHDRIFGPKLNLYTSLSLFYVLPVIVFVLQSLCVLPFVCCAWVPKGIRHET